MGIPHLNERRGKVKSARPVFGTAEIQRAIALLVVLLNFGKLITDGENTKEAFLICSDARFESLPTTQKVLSGDVLVNIQKKTKKKH